MQQIEGAVISVINDWYGMICVLSPFVVLGYVMLLLEKRSERHNKCPILYHHNKPSKR